MLSEARQDFLDSGQQIFSDRPNYNFLISPNRKSFMWVQPDGNVSIYTVKNPTDFIADADLNFTDPSIRYESYNLFDTIPDSTIVRAGGDKYVVLELTNNILKLRRNDGKEFEIVRIPPGAGMSKLKLTDDGNLILTKGNQPVWSLISPQGPPPRAAGFNIQSLLLPAAIGLGVLFFLKK